MGKGGATEKGSEVWKGRRRGAVKEVKEAGVAVEQLWAARARPCCENTVLLQTFSQELSSSAQSVPAGHVVGFGYRLPDWDRRGQRYTVLHTRV